MHVDKNLLERLESFGNRISSTGITLLLIPIYYLVAKKFLEFHKGVMVIVVVLLSVSTYFGIHKGLNKAVYEIVQQNKDKPPLSVCLIGANAGISVDAH